MKKIAIAATPLVAAIFLVGCGNNADAPERGIPDGKYKVGTVNFKGQDVDCIFWDNNAGNAAVGGMSCDFEGARSARR